MKVVASIAIAIAGYIHIYLAPQHYAHAPAHGIFFAVAGLAEIAWAVGFLRWPSRPFYYAGLAMAGGLVALWVVTRYLPAPFGHEVGAIDAGGIASKLGEMVGILALVALATQGRILGLAKQSFGRLLATAVLLGAAAGVVTYGVSRAVEPLFPFLAEAENGEPAHEHGE
ncbi:MAG TPA: hypothetical protein VI703_03015 [Anaerolineales bacterium]|jgi:hypothetical protein|nr:hypothetical protein [Anaerolineales bacterium]